MSENTHFGIFLAQRVAEAHKEAKRRPVCNIMSDIDSDDNDRDCVSLTVSKTHNALQENWNVPSEFPLCPQEYGDGESPLRVYFNNLSEKALFASNETYKSFVYKFLFVEKEHMILVITYGGTIKPYALAKITYQDNNFIHTSFGTFMTLEGAEKEFTLKQGLQYQGEDSLDDLIG